jgi:hypothetical protein
VVVASDTAAIGPDASATEPGGSGDVDTNERSCRRSSFTVTYVLQFVTPLRRDSGLGIEGYRRGKRSFSREEPREKGVAQKRGPCSQARGEG